MVLHRTRRCVTYLVPRGNRRAGAALRYIAARPLPPAGPPLLQPPFGAVFFSVAAHRGFGGVQLLACDEQEEKGAPRF